MISVIMPIKQLNLKCLPSINSVLCQDVILELIIVVDGPNSIYNDINFDNDNRVKIIELEKNIGPGSAINIGYKQTKYDIITVHDSDDISEPGRFRILLEEMGEFQAISSWVKAIKQNRTKIKKFNPTLFVIHTGKKYVASPPAHHCATFIRRDLWDIIGEYEPLIASDSQRMFKMGIYLWLSNSQLKMVQLPLYNYFIHSESYSQKNKSMRRHWMGRRRSKIISGWASIQKMKPRQFLSWWELEYKDLIIEWVFRNDNNIVTAKKLREINKIKIKKKELALKRRTKVIRSRSKK